MRQFTVTGPKTTQVYIGFNANPEGAAFKLLPIGLLDEIEGAFYCSADDLTLAVSEVLRYNLEQFNRTREVVTLIRLI